MAMPVMRGRRVEPRREGAGAARAEAVRFFEDKITKDEAVRISGVDDVWRASNLLGADKGRLVLVNDVTFATRIVSIDEAYAWQQESNVERRTLNVELSPAEGDAAAALRLLEAHREKGEPITISSERH